MAHQPRVATRRDAATVLGEKRSLGDRVQAGKQGRSFVEDVAHDVPVARGAEELQGEQGPHGTVSRDTKFRAVVPRGTVQPGRLTSGTGSPIQCHALQNSLCGWPLIAWPGWGQRPLTSLSNLAFP